MEYHQLDVHKAVMPSAITSAVSWRAPGIKYRRNEIFLDVVEKAPRGVGSIIFWHCYCGAIHLAAGNSRSLLGRVSTFGTQSHHPLHAALAKVTAVSRSHS